MNSLLTQRVAKPLLIISLLAFFFVGFIGLGHLGMDVGFEKQISNCPIMGMATICQMNPLEHLAAWQNLFAAGTPKDTFSILMSLLFALLLYFSIRSFWRIKNNPGFQEIRNSRALLRVNGLPIFAPLQEAYSDGILNPKIF